MPEEVIATVCEVFGVPREDLARKQSHKTRREVGHARGACALLAGPAAGASVAEMARRIGYRSEYFRVLGKRARTLLRWAQWPEPPPDKGVHEFRQAIEVLCQRLNVDVEELVE